MKTEIYTVGPLGTSCYHVICEKTGESVLIDPGESPKALFSGNRTLTLRAVLLTHGHFDHIGGAGEVAARTGAPIMIHSLDVPLLENPVLNGSAIFGGSLPRILPDVLLSGGERIAFGECELTVLHTPGHSPGGVSFYSEKYRTVFGGDVLFRLSVGRWDFHGGDRDTLMRTIRSTFSPMPDDTVVYPGHGVSTTIGFERKFNEFMAD